MLAFLGRTRTTRAGRMIPSVPIRRTSEPLAPLYVELAAADAPDAQDTPGEGQGGGQEDAPT